MPIKYRDEVRWATATFYGSFLQAHRRCQNGLAIAFYDLLDVVLLLLPLPIADVEGEGEREQGGDQSASASDGDVESDGGRRVVRHYRRRLFCTNTN